MEFSKQQLDQKWGELRIQVGILKNKLDSDSPTWPDEFEQVLRSMEKTIDDMRIIAQGGHV
jgi:hypothetical protein